MLRGKTINIYLPDGNPRSAKVCNLRDSIVSALYIPRINFKEFSNRAELQRAGVYFLIGENEESLIPEIYIGEAEILLDRLRNHNTNKDFWKYIIGFTSDSEKNNLNKAHVKYLESISIEFATKVNKCSLLQGKSSSKPNLSDSDRDFVLDVFDDIKVLISALGYPIFDEIKKDKQNIFICSGKGVKAMGEYDGDGFIVYNDSETVLKNVNAFKGGWLNLKEDLIKQGILKENKGKLLFTKNYIFSSPSSASAIILGRPSNGWIDWKDSNGKTLDEKYRK